MNAQPTSRAAHWLEHWSRKLGFVCSISGRGSSVVVAEWLRRQTKNMLGPASAGSDPADYTSHYIAGNCLMGQFESFSTELCGLKA